MAVSDTSRLRVAAIRFLNPAPLMWDFEHAPHAAALAARYDVHYTQPSQCAAELHAGRAALGLIPIAALTPALAIVPGCTIASLDRVRSIQLIVKCSAVGLGEPLADDAPEFDSALRAVRSIAADTASRSSVAYVQVLFRRFLASDPGLVPAAADPIAMLTSADAALLIGDPALLALERRAAIEAHPQIGPCVWIDIAHQWRTRTGLPWVAAVWAARPEAMARAGVAPEEIIRNLQDSRDHGLSNVAALVNEWEHRIALPAATIEHYLTRNIHYTLSPGCLEAIRLFRCYAAESSILPPLPNLQFL